MIYSGTYWAASQLLAGAFKAAEAKSLVLFVPRVWGLVGFFFLIL